MVERKLVLQISRLAGRIAGSISVQANVIAFNLVAYGGNRAFYVNDDDKADDGEVTKARVPSNLKDSLKLRVSKYAFASCIGLMLDVL
jgi:hypothetical protein